MNPHNAMVREFSDYQGEEQFGTLLVLLLFSFLVVFWGGTVLKIPYRPGTYSHFQGGTVKKKHPVSIILTFFTS